MERALKFVCSMCNSKVSALFPGQLCYECWLEFLREDFKRRMIE